MASEPKRKGEKGSAQGVETLSFDDALAELQRVAAELEAGSMPLEQTIEMYERGVALHGHCNRLLTDAELRIRTLVERAGGRIEALGAAAGVAGADELDESEEDETGFAG